MSEEVAAKVQGGPSMLQCYRRGVHMCACVGVSVCVCACQRGISVAPAGSHYIRYRSACVCTGKGLVSVAPSWWSVVRN